MNRRKACVLLAAAPAAAADFRSRLQRSVERPWIGPEYWSNPLQDWRLREGRIECITAGGDRNVFLLTHEAGGGSGGFTMRTRLGRLEQDTQRPGEGFAGFRTGVHGHFRDYRDSAVYGIGLNAGISPDGRLFIGRLSEAAPRIAAPLQNLELILEAFPTGNLYSLRLIARDAAGAVLGETTRSDIQPEWITGGVALVCHSGHVPDTPEESLAVMAMNGIHKPGSERGGDVRFWFKDWELTGPKVAVHQDRAWGPILWAMYTCSRRVLKLTAQMAPLGETAEPVRLQVRRGSTWRTAATSRIDPMARTATFRVPEWDDTRDTPYRIVFRLDGEHTFEGTVRKDPKDKAKIIVAGLSCNNDLGFPHSDVVRNVGHFAPDFLIFNGDQIYERVAGYGIERLPIERATLDYLRKWYLFGWEYRDLLRDTPAICMPDDHDVYHGNVWGAGGKKADGMGQPGQDSGGYTQPAPWVNMVQRTQTSHLPDPHDPAPIDQGIGVYYCDMRVGGVSFAIIEDRKWKSAPKIAMPSAQIVNGWAKSPNYHAARDGDVAGAELLGERQMKFLADWAADWSDGVWMKSVVSQTIFANVVTLPPPADTDAVTPKLPIEQPGVFPKGEVKVADHDSNGWPQTPRNRALRAIRSALAFHIAGDQHLGSTLQYGVDTWNDASWAVCCPAIANIFPRRWYPPEPGQNRKPGAPDYTGEFLDGFGNKVTVHAIFNPSAVKFAPRQLQQRAPGYGIIEFDRTTRKITVAVWPRWIDATQPGARPVEGWPITIDQTDNGLNGARYALEAVKAAPGSILQVADQGANEIVYTYRMPGDSFTPKVFSEGAYTVRVMDPAGKPVRTLKDRKTRRV
ncbi:MAG: alkaline phosphatase D family protein [Acidobacteria bacterium]|nr:alkaline phosphatase D family protein [Acidobacteriota bacterium]MBI3280245.1 alkaline phosphatase D family protein [Acidobacteriota bacterium]